LLAITEDFLRADNACHLGSQVIFLACVEGCLELAFPGRSGDPGGDHVVDEDELLEALLLRSVAADPSLAALAAHEPSRGVHEGAGGRRPSRKRARGRIDDEGGDGSGGGGKREGRDGVGRGACSTGLEAARGVALVRACAYGHYRSHGWVVKDGALLGCHWALYAGSPARVHADYTVYVLGADLDAHAVPPAFNTVDTTVATTTDATGATTGATAPATHRELFGEGCGAPEAWSPGWSWLHALGLARLVADVNKGLLLCALADAEGGPRVIEVEVR